MTRVLSPVWARRALGDALSISFEGSWAKEDSQTSPRKLLFGTTASPIDCFSSSTKEYRQRLRQEELQDSMWFAREARLLALNPHPPQAPNSKRKLLLWVEGLRVEGFACFRLQPSGWV